jgi:hypothetical protein
VCDVYRQAQELKEQGVHVVSTDEKTGIQALERAHPTLPMKPGQRKIPLWLEKFLQCLDATVTGPKPKAQ